MTASAPPPTELSFRLASEAATALREEISKALLGQQDIIDQMLVALFGAGHILIEGVPGLGKTLMVRALAQAISGHFARIQFTPDLMPSDVTGHSMYDLKTDHFKVRKGPIFTHLLLADEINRAPAKTQAALLEVMQEQQVTIEGESFQLPPPFMTLATQNPIEQEGTYPLPEAQLDRFLLKVLIDYPKEEEERSLVKAVTTNHTGDQLYLDAVQPILSPEQVVNIQKVVSQLLVDPRIIEYAVQITRTTREWSGVTVGAGPRGSIALIRAGRAQAMLQGRDFVTPDDIKDIAVAALRHRILLSAEMALEGHEVDHVIQEVLTKVEAPRL